MDSAQYWDSQAANFDAQPDHGLRDSVVRNAWSTLILPVLPPTPARIADLGCGTGTLSLLMAEAGHRVSGLDIAPQMVALAREKFARAGESAEFVIGDASFPPWRSGTFDVVLTRHVLWAMPDPAAALTKWIEQAGD